MIRRKQGILYESLEVLEVEGIVHAFCFRKQGVSKPPYDSLNFGLSTGDAPEAVKMNQAKVLDAFGLPCVVRASQVHGSAVMVIREGIGPGCNHIKAGRDALVTDRPGVALAVLTADCIPLALYDAKERVAGMVHSGWRGTVAGVCRSAVSVMAKEFGSDPKRILAGIGPGIKACCYVVDDPVLEQARSVWGKKADEFFQLISPGQYKFDMAAAVMSDLLGAGLGIDNIQASANCTHCGKDYFFSHRRDGPVTGRLLNFIMIR